MSFDYCAKFFSRTFPNWSFLSLHLRVWIAPLAILWSATWIVDVTCPFKELFKKSVVFLESIGVDKVDVEEGVVKSGINRCTCFDAEINDESFCSVVLLWSAKGGVALIHIEIFWILVQEYFVEIEEILDIVEKDWDRVGVSFLKLEGMAWERLRLNSVLWANHLPDREFHLLAQAANDPINNIFAILDKDILNFLNSFAEFLFCKLTRWWAYYFAIFEAWLSVPLTFDESL